MTGFRFISCPGYGAGIHTGLEVEGRERELLETVLSEAVDAVYLPWLEEGSMARLERSGLPFSCVGGLQLWQRRDSLNAIDDTGWTQEPGGWKCSGHEMLARLSGRDRAPASTDWLFWGRQGHSLLGRHESKYGTWIEFTSAPIDMGLLAGLGDALRPVAGDARVAVPLHQFAVQEELRRSGFEPVAAARSGVLVPGLSCSASPVHEEGYVVTAETVERYASSSGDCNPLHMDDEYARRFGFEGKISHGMIFNGWVSRYLGTVHPGNGTIFIGNSTAYFAPIYPGQAYRVRVSTPSMDNERGIFRIVAQLRNAEGRAAMIAFNDVMLKPGSKLVRG